RPTYPRTHSRPSPPITPPYPSTSPTRRSSDLDVLHLPDHRHVAHVVTDVQTGPLLLRQGQHRIGVLDGDRHGLLAEGGAGPSVRDRKSTRLNSSHVSIAYAVFCLKKKTKDERN